ncbi:hypothetical protein LOK49_LG04G03783 [Camellia lanceoleosa]|uniref:Uncharacterized protein n=1 Tax=Camellia lanceoleosa TaxID=1840588 RepID=A0ACC0I3C0_9ERIC|nr:hypothetical protein LOK49_LG04G03783 [Camellia lanceoleosa]
MNKLSFHSSGGRAGAVSEAGKKKRGVVVKCEGSSSTGQQSYEKNFCLCVSTGEEIDNPSEWYMVNLSSNKDKEKEEEEEEEEEE